MFCLLNEAQELERLEFEEGRTGGLVAIRAEVPGEELRPAGQRSSEVRQQVLEYLRGERTSFDLDLARNGTPFQERVWKALRRIRFGKTITYPELASRAGNPAAIRAAAHANASNPLSLIVPCHRVVAVDGSLRGYGGGLPVKLALLEFERSGGRAKLSRLLARARQLMEDKPLRVGDLPPGGED